MNALSSAMQAYLVEGTPSICVPRKTDSTSFWREFATGGWGPNEGFVVPGSGALGTVSTRRMRALRRPAALRPLQGCAVFDERHRREPLRRQHGTRSLQRRTRRASHACGRHGVLLFRLQRVRLQGLFRIQVSLLFRNVGPDRGGLWDQRLFDERRRHLRQSLRAVRHALAAERPHHHPAATTTYPLDPEITISVQTATPETFSVVLRIPAWAGSDTTVAVNGRRLDVPVIPGRFHTIRRTWSDADRVTLVLDMPIRLEAVDERHPDRLAVMKGPLALFATGDRFLPFTRKDLSSVRQVSVRLDRLAGDDVRRRANLQALFCRRAQIDAPLPAGLGLNTHQNST